MGMGPIPPDLAATAGEGASLGDLHEQAQASEGRELAYEARSRLMKRLGELQHALRQLQQGTYGKCQECGRPIPGRRLLTVPEATLCVPCQERQERASAGRRGSR